MNVEIHDSIAMLFGSQAYYLITVKLKMNTQSNFPSKDPNETHDTIDTTQFNSFTIGTPGSKSKTQPSQHFQPQKASGLVTPPNFISVEQTAKSMMENSDDDDDNDMHES